LAQDRAGGELRCICRQPRWHLALVLLAAALPCIAAGCGAAYPAYGPDYGIMTI
jgi:hypothetical protein